MRYPGNGAADGECLRLAQPVAFVAPAMRDVCSVPRFETTAMSLARPGPRSSPHRLEHVSRRRC